MPSTETLVQAARLRASILYFMGNLDREGGISAEEVAKAESISSLGFSTKQVRAQLAYLSEMGLLTRAKKMVGKRETSDYSIARKVCEEEKEGKLLADSKRLQKVTQSELKLWFSRKGDSFGFSLGGINITVSVRD